VETGVGGVGVLGVIAGNGIYPHTFVRAARSAGEPRLVAACFRGETEEGLLELVDEAQWFRVGQLTRMIRFFQDEGVGRAVMVGQIAPGNLFDLRPDLRTLMMLARVKERNAESLFGAIADELKGEGIELLPATTYLDELLPEEGQVAGPAVKARRWEDARYGFRIAKECSRLDIGQTVVVKKGTVLAVEAFEGTDEAVRRGGALGRGGATLVKVSKPGQDLRFDVPVVGPRTIEVAAGAGVDVVVVEAGKTLLLGGDELTGACVRLGVALLAV
jgi:UDP-2,3-diacylglucosamine hydrolase